MIGAYGMGQTQSHACKDANFREKVMASTLETLRRETRALVFDQYGTVVDMQGGLVDAVTPFLKKKGWAGNPTSS